MYFNNKMFATYFVMLIDNIPLFCQMKIRKDDRVWGRDHFLTPDNLMRMRK